jgi:hypothetical protein
MKIRRAFHDEEQSVLKTQEVAQKVLLEAIAPARQYSDRSYPGRD